MIEHFHGRGGVGRWSLCGMACIAKVILALELDRSIIGVGIPDSCIE
jgi:hypothetical protein